MAIARFGRQVKHSYQSYGFSVKLSAAVLLGMCFVFTWSMFSKFSVTSQRESFDDIAEPVSGSIGKVRDSRMYSEPKLGQESGKLGFQSGLENKEQKKINGSVSMKPEERHESDKSVDKGELGDEKSTGEEKIHENQGTSGDEVIKEKVGDEADNEEGEELDSDGNENEVEEDSDLVNAENSDQESLDEVIGSSSKKKKRNLGPLFDPKARYTWKLCNTRSKYNYIPCIDLESGTGKLQRYRHRERSCPRSAVMCLVPLPRDGYADPVRWPESRGKILYKNVAHPRLVAFIKTQDWSLESGEYLTFLSNQSVFKGGIQHYIESIEEMVPDIEWEKNIRVVLDIGCQDSSLVASLLESGVLALTLGLKDDLMDLAQVALERGFPAVVSPFAARRLPFPSGVFDAIHCGECNMPWHSNGGKLILEMNRILRPGGYFIISKYNTVEAEEALSLLTSSICWNILADKTEEVSDIAVKIYQKPEANDIYVLRRKKIPALCKEDENPDSAWYMPLKTCLHTIPEGIEQRGTEWPAEWPKRLNVFPEWINDREKMMADNEHWKAIVNNSYLTGMGINWSAIRNVMDMQATTGGFAAALSDQNVWVMNVVPVHAPMMLPIIFERGLVGVYHDWCESFGSYPRSYDLLHADHLFSRLKKNRCKQTTTIIVEMDRILRPSGWMIIRDKVDILNPVEDILRSLHWDIRLTFAQNKEGILCAQKTIWRP